jgi:hypothetical protein
MNQMAREQLLDQLGCELTFNLLMLVCSPEALANTSMTAREAQALLCFFLNCKPCSVGAMKTIRSSAYKDTLYLIAGGRCEVNNVGDVLKRQ